ncbi:hypothetical protein SAMN05444921_13167 [Streptomyces wuyuanensis]|uniref:Uncharacterized protein n=1 Tax=Streptomyces wuyuanensis TaxID=1196353 RepID=A0A1H0CXH1_9ACTN|nr:hypothetical protein SAMN05444921_13167 [Streptomyces wuyuanensis]
MLAGGCLSRRAEDLPGLHAGEDVLGAGADLFVGLVVFLYPVREFGLAAFAAVRDDEAGAHPEGSAQPTCFRGGQ